MNRSSALAWLHREAGPTSRFGDFGEPLQDLIGEVREQLTQWTRVGSPREAARAYVRLHELEFHVIPALEVP